MQSVTGHADMFLKVQCKKLGPIKGEALDVDHSDEIEVLGWAWGLRAKSGLGGAAAGKDTPRELEIVKRVDSASTALMLAMHSNDLIKMAILTVRKVGGDKLEYLKITISDARITALDLQSGGAETDADLAEKVSFAFNKITVDYVPQSSAGSGKGGMCFEGDWTPQGS